MIKRKFPFGSGRGERSKEPARGGRHEAEASIPGQDRPQDQQAAGQGWAGEHATAYPNPAAATERPGEEAAGPGTASPPPRGTDRWAPIVVDDPIFDFEPKPPDTSTYMPDADTRLFRPDTVFDGWSSDDFTVRLASVRGYSHRYSGLPRQDDAEVACHQASGTIMFAVADGVSSASLSHVGAAIACSFAVDVMRWQLNSEHPVPDLPYVAAVAAKQLAVKATAFLRQESPEPTEIEKLLATTLIAGYARRTREGAAVSMIQIGDSSAWILRDGRYYPAGNQKNDPQAQIITSAVSPLPRIPANLAPFDFTLPPDGALLIGTDGFGDPLGDGDGKVGQLFAGHLLTPPSPRALAHLLDFSRDTFDDDRTLIVLWPRSQEAGRTQ